MSPMLLLILLSTIDGFTANSCNFKVKLHQELQNKGFHRNLTFKLTFQDSYKYKGCHVALDQTLPSGVYASPDELGDLSRMNKLTAIPKNRVNIEQLAEESQPTSVLIIGELNGRELNLWLPVHARYHRAAKGGGFFHNEIERPRVFIRCQHLQLDDCEPKLSQATFICSGSGKETCLWKEISIIMLTSQLNKFSVPVGDLDHNSIVAPATAATLIIFSLYLLKTLHEYKMAAMQKGFKNKPLKKK